MGNLDKDKEKGNPQLENGYLKIACELYEQIYKTPFNGVQLRIISCILRNTYGYHRVIHNLSAGYIATCINVNPRTVQRELRKLEKTNVIKVYHGGGNTINRIGINKKYTEWTFTATVNRPLRSTDRNPYGQQTVTGYGQQTVTGYGQQTVQQIIDKERIEEKKDKKKRYAPSFLREHGIPDDFYSFAPADWYVTDDGLIGDKTGALDRPETISWDDVRADAKEDAKNGDI